MRSHCAEIIKDEHKKMSKSARVRSMMDYLGKRDKKDAEKRKKDKNTGEQRERAEWHRVVIFNDALGRIAEQYLKKGSTIYLEGQLQTRKWEQDGQTRYTTEVVGRDMQFLDSRGSSSSDSSSYEDTNQDMSSQNLPDSGITDDDIPF